MFTIVGSDGKEYGPVAADKVREWIAGGRANLQTKARQADNTEWKILGDFADFAPPGLAPEPPPLTAAVPPPPAMAPAEPVDPRSLAAGLIARAAPLDVFGCLARSFELWKANFFPLVGITLLVLVVQVMANLVPLLGLFSSLCLNGVFSGGLYYYYLGKMRGEPRQAGDAFAGFSLSFVPLMLTSLLITGVIFALMFLFFGSWFFLILAAALHHHAGALPETPSGPMLLGLLAGSLAIFYLSISWSFAFVLVLDKGLGPWTALEVSRRVITKQWFRVFFTLFFGGILAMLGLVGLIIGVLFTLPLTFGTLLYAYEDLCNPPGAKGG